MDSHATVLRKLRDQGFRETRARKALIELLLTSNQPLAIAEIQDNLKKTYKIGTNKTTVYREISFLIDQQVAREVDFGDKKKRYESAIAGHHHHLVCTNCGRIEDFELKQDLQNEEQRISSEKNFKVTSHTLEFFGLCANCR